MTGYDVWEVRRQVVELSRAGNHDRAIELGEAALEQQPEFAPLASAFGWAFYRRDLSDLDDQKDLPTRQRAKAALDRIAELCGRDPYGKYSPWPNAALKLAEVLSKRWPTASLDVLTALDPERLVGEKEGDFEAPRVRWVMIRTKALEAAGLWRELLAACDAALEDASLGNNNGHWVALRRCEALRHIGRAEEAEPILRAKAEESGDWWLFERLAQVQESLGRENEAIGTAYRALNSTRVTSFQWRVVFFLARLLEGRDPDLAAKHARLARAFRREEGWPADGQLMALCARLSVRDALDQSSRELVADLGRVWRRIEDAERDIGRVDRHLSEGSGFIKPDRGGEPIYFARARSSNQPLPEVGARVSYLVQKSFDKKKNRESLRAVKWCEIKD